MPEKTLEATFDHAPLHGDAVTGSYAQAQAVLDELAARRRRLRRRDRAARDARASRSSSSRGTNCSIRSRQPWSRPALGGREVSVTVVATGAAAEAVDRIVPQLVADHVASGITTLDSTLWGPEAEDEASKRLGWTEAVAISEPARRRHPRAARRAARSRRQPHRARRHGRLVARPRGHHPHLRRAR